MPVKPPSSAVMLVSVARSSVDSCATAAPANSNTLPTPAPARIARQREQMQHDVLRGHARRAAGHRSSMRSDLRHGHAHRAGDERVRHVGRADAERDAAERAAMRRVRVGADDDLPRQRVALGHHRVRDAVRAVVGAASLRSACRACADRSRATNARCASDSIARRSAAGRRARAPGFDASTKVILERDDAIAGRAARADAPKVACSMCAHMPV